jgi:hypothetical protein
MLTEWLDFCREIQADALEDRKGCYTSNAIEISLEDGRFELRQGNENMTEVFVVFQTPSRQMLE